MKQQDEIIKQDIACRAQYHQINIQETYAMRKIDKHSAVIGYNNAVHMACTI